MNIPTASDYAEIRIGIVALLEEARRAAYGRLSLKRLSLNLNTRFARVGVTKVILQTMSAKLPVGQHVLGLIRSVQHRAHVAKLGFAGSAPTYPALPYMDSRSRQSAPSHRNPKE